MKRKVYRIMPSCGEWKVLGDCGRRWARQADAAAYYAGVCRRMKAEGKPAQLVLHGRDGRIRWERTYGADPKRSRG